MKKKLNKNYAYIDGSFNPNTKRYGWGGFLVDQYEKKHIITGSGGIPKYIELRNVAGEILGATEVIKMALDLGMKTLTLYHDYEGISNWPLYVWKATKPETKKYAEFVRKSMEKRLKIFFVHTKAHAGIHGNEEADKLARKAVGLK